MKTSSRSDFPPDEVQRPFGGGPWGSICISTYVSPGVYFQVCTPGDTYLEIHTWKYTHAHLEIKCVPGIHTWKYTPGNTHMHPWFPKCVSHPHLIFRCVCLSLLFTRIYTHTLIHPTPIHTKLFSRRGTHIHTFHHHDFETPPFSMCCSRIAWINTVQNESRCGAGQHWCVWVYEWKCAHCLHISLYFARIRTPIHPYTPAVLNFNALSSFPRAAWGKVNNCISKSNTRTEFRPRGTAKSKKA